eukprot:INCI6199.1.p1 GENE.INCI6199.1~~INCI6199.1.p1  ORF type:complete len:578 (-),score=48.33 INCI6199.1:192-1925(-)
MPSIMHKGIAQMVLIFYCLSSTSRAQLKSSLLDSYFDERPKNCTALDACASPVLARLTGHVSEAGLYLGGVWSPTLQTNRSGVCLESSADTCLSWYHNSVLVDNPDEVQQVAFGNCQCQTLASACALRRNSTGGLQPGNISAIGDSRCDVVNNNSACGWDQGDCGEYSGDDSNIPFLNSSFCGTWTCEQAVVHEPCGDLESRRLSRHDDADDAVSSGVNMSNGAREDFLHDRTYYDPDAPSLRIRIVPNRRFLGCASTTVSIFSECACITVADEGRFCQRWYCESFEMLFPYWVADANRMDYFPLYQREWYECTVASDSGMFCQEWGAVTVHTNNGSINNNGHTTAAAAESWDVVDGDHISLSKCSCVNATLDEYPPASGDSDNVFGEGIGIHKTSTSLHTGFSGCALWECQHARFDKWDLAYVMFGAVCVVSLAIPIMLTIVVSKHGRPSSCKCRTTPKDICRSTCIVTGFIVCSAGLVAIGTYGIGVPGAVVMAIILWSPWLAVIPKDATRNCKKSILRLREKCCPPPVRPRPPLTISRPWRHGQRPRTPPPPDQQQANGPPGAYKDPPDAVLEA